MEKFILPDESPEARLRYLQDSADEVVNDKYFKKMNGEELTEKKSEFTANNLKLKKIEAEKKEIMDEYKERMKPLKDEDQRLANEINTGFVEYEGKLFKFIDDKTRMVYFYDVNGELVSNKTRPADTDELQNTIYMETRKNGTND